MGPSGIRANVATGNSADVLQASSVETEKDREMDYDPVVTPREAVTHRSGQAIAGRGGIQEGHSPEI